MASLRSLFISFALVLLQFGPAQGAPLLERGTAVTDPDALRELDRSRFGLARMLGASSGGPLTDNALFALPAVAPVRKTLDEEFDRYVQQHRIELPNETIGVGPQFDFQLFDRDQLYSGTTRFVLAGIVNRMDRAFVDPASCGEIRLIYRLTQIDAPPVGDHGASARLPMTLNLVLKARADGAASLSCATIARRWLDTASLPLTGSEFAARLTAADGALSSIGPENVD